MPVLISQTLRSVEIAYGPDCARFKRIDVNETGTKTTRYLSGGAVEIVLDGGSTLNKTHIGGQAVVLQTFAAQHSIETRHLKTWAGGNAVARAPRFMLSPYCGDLQNPYPRAVSQRNPVVFDSCQSPPI
ncbi:MAG: hypothetical protein NW215_03865 [Hyphomicrobiales bacterium]|nr:hypothetical protein [Hyphomicrobiales bacterium]